MMRLKSPKFGALLTLLLVMPVLAQTATPVPEPTSTAVVSNEDCPLLVQDALKLTQDSCTGVDNNKVCYGHSTLEAASRPGTEDFQFDEPGDIEDVIEMQSLSLSPMDTALQQWGVILMQVESAVQSSDDNGVTFVVFGNTDLTAPTTLFEVDVTQNANLRREPETTSEVIGVVTPGETVMVNGRTSDSAWLRARFTTAEGGVQVGWLSTSLVSTTEDLETLDAVEPDELDSSSPLQYGPMQAFYFQSGVDDAPCAAAPNSGMMIQTPEGQATVTLWIDEVIIELDGTAFVQADAGGDLTVTTLDGSANVTANGETRTAIEGTQIDVPIGDDLTASDVPNDPVPLDPDNVQSLPTELLENPVDIPDPLLVVEGAPASGSWLFSWDVTEATCPDGSVWTFENGGIPSNLNVTEGGAVIGWSGRSYNQQSTGVYIQAYVGADGNLYQETLTVEALDRISGEAVIDLAVTACTLTVPFRLQLVGTGS